MLKKCIILVLIFIFYTQTIFAGLTEYSYFNKYSQLRTQDIEPVQLVKNEVTETSQSVQYKNKSPVLTFLIALGPGFFLHGAGHYYIGDYKKAKGFFKREIISITIITIGGLMNIAENEEMDKKHNYDPKIGRPTTLGLYMVVIGFYSFLLNWAVSVISAPICASKYTIKVYNNMIYLNILTQKF
jgi:hypothetical protein